MKAKLFIPFILFLFLWGCKEEKKIEIIPDYDKIYLPLGLVNETPQLIEGNEEELIKDIKEVLNSISTSNKAEFHLDYNFMLNETGTVDKIEIVKSDIVKVDDLVLAAIKDWKFNPGVKDGKNVKSQYRWKLYLSDDKVSKQINEDVYYVAVEAMPEIIGGLFSIQKNITYPEIAKRAGIEGKVYVLAFINEEGNVVNARVIKGIGAGCDEAALNAVKQTKFNPGRQNGKPVKVQVTIPIVFKLQ